MPVKSIGQRVTIRGLGFNNDFEGTTGTIIDNTDRDGRTPLYRVRFDTPVVTANARGVDVPVDSELFPGCHMVNVQSAAAKARRARWASIRDAYASVGMTRVRGNLGGTYYE